MGEVLTKTFQGRTEAGEPLEITIYQPPGEVVIHPGNEYSEPICNPAPPVAVSGWYGLHRQPFEVWLVDGEYLNPANGQRGETFRAALPSQVARGTW